MKNIFISLILFFASCGKPTDSKVSSEKSNVQPTIVGQEKMIENALTFINSYVDNCNKMKESIGIIEWANTNQLTTQSFKTELKRQVDEANKLEPEIGLDGDPIFDAQYYPDEGFELDSLHGKTNYIVVKGKNKPDFKLTIKMINDKNMWLVDGCGIINIPVDMRISR